MNNTKHELRQTKKNLQIRVSQIIKPTQKKRYLLKHPLGHDKLHDSNGIYLGRKTAPAET